MGVAHDLNNVALNGIALKTIALQNIAHGVGSYKHPGLQWGKGAMPGAALSGRSRRVVFMTIASKL